MPFLGVALRKIDDKVVVTRVIPGSAAYIAGIQKDDVILSIDGERVRYPKEVTAVVVRKKVGDEVKITLMRYGKKLEIAATLEAKSKVLEETSKKHS